MHAHITRRWSHLSRTAVLAAAAVTGLSATASAQIAFPNIYHWGMPDVDQSRSGLPGNGNSHCVPTSHLNMLLYIEARSTIPLDLVSGVNDPQANSQHFAITGHLFSLGQLSQVVVGSGTNVAKMSDALDAYLGVNNLFLSRTYKSGALKRRDLYMPMKAGGLVAICYGRWSFVPSESHFERSGGHCVTVLGIEDYYFPFQPESVIGINPKMNVIYRDPATSDGDLFKQSQFSFTERTVEPFFGTCQGYDDDAVLLQLGNTNPGDPTRLIDSMSVIYPIFGLKQNSPTQFQLAPALNMTDNNDPLVIELPNLVATAQGLQPTDVFAIQTVVGGGSTIAQIDFINNTRGPALNLVGRSPVMTAGRRGEVYVHANNQLRCLAPDEELRLVDGPTPLPVTTAPVAMAYNDQLDQVLLLINSNQINEYSRTLPAGIPPTIRTFATPPAFSGAGRRMIVGDGSVREYWFGPLTDGTIKSYTPDPNVPTRMVVNRSITIPGGGAGVTDFQIDDEGNPLFVRNGRVEPARFNIATGRWERNTQHPFNNLGVGSLGTFFISRSRTDYDLAIHNTPGWNTNPDGGDPLATETVDCLADVGRQGGEAFPDGILDNNDFIVYIDWFFSRYERADIGIEGGAEGADGLFDNNDFIVYIQRFFSGCP